MSGLQWLAAAGAAALGAGALAPILGPWARAGLVAQALGTAALGTAGALVLFGADPLGAPFADGLAPRLGVDGLSGFFLATIALVGAPAMLYARDYLSGAPRERSLAVLSGLFVASLILVVCGRDPSTFLAGWELMTLLPAAAILAWRAGARERHAAFVYLAVTHLGGAGVWVAILVLAQSGSLAEPGAVLSQGGGVQGLVIAAALIGFGTKAGLMPLHAWLPRAHPVAPSHISALMSGVMVKVALYGLLRVLFEWAAPAPLWAGLALLGVGALSALGGAVWALTQHELKRLLAFSSIENVGIVALGTGAAIVLDGAGEPTWGAIAFAAALLHSLNHAAFKGLLFLSAGAVERVAGSLDLDRLGGLARRAPWTAACFGVGALAIAGVPPLNGFASEWMTMQALIHTAFGPGLGSGLAAGAAAAALAATAALAAYAFVKAVGLVTLGEPRSAEAAAAREARGGMLVGPLILAVACLALAAAPGLLVPSLAALGPAEKAGTAGVPGGPGLDLPGTGSLPSPWLALALAALAGLLWLVRGSRRAAPVPAWTCGQRREPAMAWTSAGFAKPLQLALAGVLRPRREVQEERSGGVLTALSYSGEVPHLFDTGLYGPLRRLAVRGAGAARRLQSGSVRAYAAYMLVLVLIVLALVRTGAIG